MCVLDPVCAGYGKFGRTRIGIGGIQREIDTSIRIMVLILDGNSEKICVSWIRFAPATVNFAGTAGLSG